MVDLYPLVEYRSFMVFASVWVLLCHSGGYMKSQQAALPKAFDLELFLRVLFSLQMEVCHT